ncbi:hypothetical protein BKA93DRAFT_747343 [Sparassis latifolia]
MSEDDRAAKAARARAMLKKRQQQKASGTPAASSPTISSPNLRPSRAFSPAPSDTSLTVVEDEKGTRNAGDLFGKHAPENGSDASWLSGLHRVDSNPSHAVAVPSPLVVYSRLPTAGSPATSPPATSTSVISPPISSSPIISPPASSPSFSPPTNATEREYLRALVQDQRRAISVLESEKASLTASLEHLKQMESKAQHTHELLQEECAKSGKLQKDLQRIEADARQLSGQLKRQEETAAATLASETASLSRTIDQLNLVQSKVQETEAALITERNSSRTLHERIKELERSVQDYGDRSDQQQQTISLLVSEKTSLTASLEQLGDVESRLQEAESLLQTEQENAERLQKLVHQLEAEGRESADQLIQLSSSEKVLTDKCKDQDVFLIDDPQEREIQLLTGTTSELRNQAEQYSRRIHELEEQIQSDDRVERLEATLQNTQDRADDLEFQLSKLKQINSAMKAERDAFEAQVRLRTDAEADWRGRHAESEKQHATTQEQLAAVAAERDSLANDKTSLLSQEEDRQSAVNDLQQRLARLAAELTTTARQLQQAQSDARTANLRVDEAERMQTQLQTEGFTLMRNVNEMRPKIVELTNAKLDLTDKADSLQNALRARDATIAQLEASLDELRDGKEQADRERQAAKVTLEKERSSSHESTLELHKAYTELQLELEQTRSSIQDLEAERANYHQMTERHFEEVDHLSSTLQTHMEQLSQLRIELEERQRAQEEAQDFLEHTRGEMDALRAELASKDEELEHLRDAVSSPSTPGPHSLDEEMLSSLKQQHVLELSSAQSQIRSLETSIFQAEARAHSLQKQVSVLEDQHAQLRPSSRASQRSALPFRPSSRAVDHSDELRRASFTSHRSPNLAPPPSAFDGLSLEARHKRRVSLGMLKARIDSEVAAAINTSRPSSKLSSPLPSFAGLSTVVEPFPEPASPSLKKPQFLDEAHIFWCHSCEGDLVIL